MKRRKQKEEAGEIFRSIRKPTAPASHKLGSEKREDKLDPVRRKTKHKRKHPIDADI